MQWLALESDAFLTYASIIIITTRAVVMPKKSIDTTVNRGRFYMLKIYQNRGEVSEGCPGGEWHSGLQIGRAPPTF